MGPDIPSLSELRKGSRPRQVFLAVTCLLGLAAFALLASGIFVGIKWDDEPWYVAKAYRFVLGDRPFRDDIGVSGFWVFLYPFVWMFYKFTGGTEGIIPFMRGVSVLVRGLVKTRGVSPAPASAKGTPPGAGGRLIQRGF